MTTMRALLPILAVLATIPAANAATLRPVATLHGSGVKLSDLFDGLQPGQDCTIGPAPPPGRRLIVPSLQIQAIASQFGVDLRDAAGRSVAIERPARTVRRDEVAAVLKPALIAAGMPADSDVDMGIFAGPVLAADNTAPPTVAGLDYDLPTGRFSASLQFASPDADTQSVRVTGRADEMVQALSLLHPVAAGSPVTASDVAPARIRKAALHGAPVTDIAQVAGLVTHQSLSPGVPLLQDQMLRPLLVARGRPVVLRLTSGGLALTAAGTALEPGGSGDRVHVMNSLTHAVLLGTVVGGSDVVIDPGTAPVFLAQNNTGGQLPRLAGNTAQFPGLAQEAR